MIDLSCSYLGQRLANPLVVAASPITRDLDLVRRAEDNGAAAFVMHSLFEEQIHGEALDLHEYLEQGREAYAESLSYLPDMQNYNMGPEGYLEQLRQIKAAVKVPVFASLNGTSLGGWIEYAKLMQDAGADGLELNYYIITTDPRKTGQQLEADLLQLVRSIKAEIRIPLAVKLSPFFTAPANVVAQLHEAGVSAAVLFNRFYQPDLDIDNLDVNSHLRLSHSEELLPRLHWCSIIFGRVPIELAITGGAHSARDVIKGVMSGANVVQLTSVLLRRGVGVLNDLLSDLRHWMHEKDYIALSEMHGCLSLQKVPDPSAYERGNYMRMLRQHTASGHWA